MKTRNFQFWKTLLINETMFSLLMMRRYLFDTVVGLVTVYILFLVIFYGLKVFAGGNIEGAQLDAIIVGYILWMFALSAYTSTSGFILEEAKQGTLEQLFMSPAGFHNIMLVRLAVSFGTSAIFNMSLLFLTMLTTGRWLDIPLFAMLGVIALAIPSVYGLGYIIAGFAILFKRVAAISNIMQFILIGLVSLSSVPLNALSFLPFTSAANLVNQMIVEDTSISLWWLGFIALNSLVYYVVGVLVFKFFEKRAMALNVLGHY